MTSRVVRLNKRSTNSKVCLTEAFQKSRRATFDKKMPLGKVPFYVKLLKGPTDISKVPEPGRP